MTQVQTYGSKAEDRYLNTQKSGRSTRSLSTLLSPTSAAEQPVDKAIILETRREDDSSR